MYYRYSDLAGMSIRARDDGMGDVSDVLFDERYWTLRYFVVDTGHWLPGRKVLIAPEAVDGVDLAENDIAVDLTCRQVKDSPGIDLDPPVSRQKEIELRNYYNWPLYWSAYPAGIGGGPLLYPLPAADEVAADRAEARGKDPGHDGDPNLRSASEVKGYTIQAMDGDIGHVTDYLLDSATWIVRYIVVDTRKWLPGRKLIVPPVWVQRVDWAGRDLHVDLSRKRIEESPTYDHSSPLDREFETRLHEHFGRPGHWRNDEGSPPQRRAAG